MSTNEQKKTNYPDLERLPNTSFFGHLLNWIWNKPRWFAEGLFEKHFLTTKRELQKTWRSPGYFLSFLVPKDTSKVKP